MIHITVEFTKEEWKEMVKYFLEEERKLRETWTDKDREVYSKRMKEVSDYEDNIILQRYLKTFGWLDKK